MRLWTCTQADLRRGGAALVILVGIIGLATGVVLASVAGARRTNTAYERLVRAEGTAEVFLFAQGELTADDISALRDIPGTEISVSSIVPLASGASGIDRRHDFGLIMAVDQASLDLRRPHHLRGRMPAPDRPNEIVVNELVAGELGVGPGDDIVVVGPTEAAFGCLEGAGCDGNLLNGPLELVVSGVLRTVDDIDPDAFNGALAFAGPGLANLLPAGYPQIVTVADVHLDAGPAGADKFIAELEERFPERFGAEADDPAETNVRGTFDTEARALLAFASFAGAAGLVASAQAWARHVASGRDGRRVLAALGLTATERTLILARTAVIVAVTAVPLAFVVAVLASPVFPVGVAGRAEPDRGFHADWLVLAGGGLSAAVFLVVIFSLLAVRAVRSDPSVRTAIARPRSARRALPVVAAIGVDLALPSVRRPGWTSTVGAAVGTMAAVATAVAAVVLVASNARLQGDPQVFGQPWDASVSLAPGGVPPLAERLAGNDVIESLGLASSGVTSFQGPHGEVPAFAVGFELVSGNMEPALLDGRAPRTPTEVALGTEVLGDLGLSIGDDVQTALGDRLHIVGRAIVPIVGADFPDEGALFTTEGFERHATPDVQGEETEAAVAFDVKPGVDLEQAMESALGPEISLAGAPARTPSDVTTLAGIGRLPVAIALFAAVVAFAALVHAMVVLVRGRGRELAALRASGLAGRHSAWAVRWAAASIGIVSTLFGVPAGIALGRVVWHVTTGAINVLDRPVVPRLPIAAVAVLTLGASLVAAAWPARSVRRMRLADVLRSE